MSYQLEDLLYLMERLRDPEHGCPWDLQQSFASIAPHTLEEAYEVAKRLRTGTLVMNNGNQLHRAPFGGFKHSGFGREGGKFGLDEFVEIKALFV